MVRKKLLTRTLIVIRRIHLYAGLFLLPWVFLYGITGAMFNHQGLLPEISITDLDREQLADSRIQWFPQPEELARRVVDSLRDAAPNATIVLASEPRAEYNNNVILEVRADGKPHAVHIDPVARSARITTLPDKEDLPRLLGNVHNVRLADNPYHLAQQSVPDILSAAGLQASQSARPRGWCKLNFLAEINGELARVTYVLRDGHVDVMKFDGRDGMTTRQFFLRLHTSHGQPPHWNGRMFWSLILDVMAIAMVTWGITGLVMWWQLKRTRLIGSLVILASITTAVMVYMSMSQFYAQTML